MQDTCKLNFTPFWAKWAARGPSQPPSPYKISVHSLDQTDFKDGDVEHAGHFGRDPRLERDVPCPSVSILKW